MAMTVKKRRDAKSYKCIEHRIADVRNGALVIARGATSGGWILPEGALLFELSDIETAQGQKGSNIFRVLPCVKIAADAEATATKVKFAHGSCSFQGAVFPSELSASRLSMLTAASTLPSRQAAQGRW